MKKKVKLEPPDLSQCQAETPNGYNFLTLGGIPGYVRCPNTPLFIATEIKPKNGQRGSMSLCEKCRTNFLDQVGKNYATFEFIKIKDRRKNRRVKR
jgi:hypothetical protein